MILAEQEDRAFATLGRQVAGTGRKSLTTYINQQIIVFGNKLNWNVK